LRYPEVVARAEASGRHVLSEMLSDEDLRRPSLYFLSHYNSKEDIDALMDALKK
jgi:selenocysteine lyase/cysteine desulfurase